MTDNRFFFFLMFLVGLVWFLAPREMFEYSMKWSPFKRRDPTPRMVLAYRVAGAVIMLVAIVGFFIASWA